MCRISARVSARSARMSSAARPPTGENSWQAKSRSGRRSRKWRASRPAIKLWFLRRLRRYVRILDHFGPFADFGGEKFLELIRSAADGLGTFAREPGIHGGHAAGAGP